MTHEQMARLVTAMLEQAEPGEKERLLAVQVELEYRMLMQRLGVLGYDT